MAGSGDKQPLTALDKGDKAPVGILNRTKRSISTTLRDKSHKRTNNNRNNQERGWQNPSYEMTETKDSKANVENVDVINIEGKGDEAVTTEKQVGTKGKKTARERAKPNTPHQSCEVQERENRVPETIVTTVNETGAGQRDVPPKPPSRPSRRNRRKLPAPAAEMVPLATLRSSGQTSDSVPAAANAVQVMGVLVHQCDRLDAGRWQLSRPMVRVHVIDTNSGEPVQKQDPQRHVSYFYEPDSVTAILPVMTRPGTAGATGFLLWDELLVFNESLAYLTGLEPRVCLMLEVLTSHPQLTAVAWAFLRLVGVGGRANTERRLRLQLLRPPADRALRAKPIYSWWRSGGRHKLAGTLHVTVSGVTPPQLAACRRSLFPTQPERAAKAEAAPGRRGSDEPEAAAPPPAWSRLHGQQCRLPTVSLLTLADDAEACQALRFDGTGHRLACGVQRGTQFPVFVYQVPSGVRTHALLGHAGLVYEVVWGDELLLTASADWTARLWRLQDTGGFQSLVLPHPGYVYTALFHLTTPRYLVTGCYDGVVRVWKTSSHELSAEPRLTDELTAGAAAVNSLCWAADGSHLYVGDASGQLTVWAWRSRRSRPEVTQERSVSVEAADGAPINQLVLHPAGQRLFVQARNGVVVALDTKHLLQLQLLTGHLNSRALVRGCLTPCGTYYLSGSEDGCLHVWNADTGERCAALTALSSTRPVVAVQFHPWEHMLAAATYRDPRVTVQLLSHEPAASGADIGLTLLPRAIQPAPAEAAQLPPPALQQQQEPVAAEDDRRFQDILNRLDSVLAVARGGGGTGAGDVSRLSTASAPDGCQRPQGVPATDPVQSRRRRRRREQKQQQALNRTDPIA